MKELKEQKFTGERALFQSSDLQISYCTFDDGESPLKESHRIHIDHGIFRWKYPLWYCNDITVSGSVLFNMARAGIWYSHHVNFYDTTIQAPKAFRRCQDLHLEKVEFVNAEETLWNCQKVTMKEVTAKGDYFAMGCSDLEIEGLTLVGDYSFDGVRNMTIRDSKILSKDAFWNAENITVYNSFISGEYLGWNSKNVTLIDCTIESLQGMCYMENLVLKKCKLLNTDLAFEYSTVDAEVTSRIESVKNPCSGRIVAESIDDIIFDNPEMKACDTEIVEKCKPQKDVS